MKSPNQKTQFQMQYLKTYWTLLFIREESNNMAPNMTINIKALIIGKCNPKESSAGRSV